MTALGKTLVIFMLILSLVWCGLTVNAFATRTNWATQAKDAQDKAKAAADLARQWEEAYKKVVADSDAALKKLADDNKAKDDAIAKLEQSYQKLNADFQTKVALEIRNNDINTQLNKNVEQLQQQLDLTKAGKDKVEGQLIESTRSEQNAKNAALTAKLEVEQARARAELLEQSLQTISDQLRDYRLGRAGGSTVPVRPDIRASIAKVTDGLLTISLGADAGLAKGAVLSVVREGKYLGQVRITNIAPKVSVGEFLPPGGTRPTGDNLPRVGDIVQVIGN